MSVDLKTMARAKAALQTEGRRYLYDNNINLIDFGNPESNGQIDPSEVAIRFHVHQKLPQIALEQAVSAGTTVAVPPSIGGFKTDVRESTFKLHQGWGWGAPRTANLRARRFDPLQGGISISDAYHNAYGTLGGIVRDRTTGKPMILSNWHVLVVTWWARRGQPIYQPGRLDGGLPADTVATLERDAMASSLDAAVATLTGARSTSNIQYDLGAVRAARQATLGMEVAKSGRRSAVTYGVVTGMFGMIRMRYGGLERIIRHVITIDLLPGQVEVSAPGDSGSFWLDRKTMNVVGLHFAGADRPEFGLALDMPTVLAALDVELLAS